MDRYSEEKLLQADIEHSLNSLGIKYPEIGEIISYNGYEFKINESGVVEVLTNQGWYMAVMCMNFWDLPFSLQLFINEAAKEDDNFINNI